MRDLTVSMQAALAGRTIAPFLLCDLELLSGFIYLWTGIGDLSFGGNTYKGVGTFGNISPISLTQQTLDQASADNITLSLSGIPTDLLSGALGEVRQNKKCRLYLGLWDINANAAIANPILIAIGNTDVPTPSDGADTCTIAITVETPLVGLQRASMRRYTNDDQKREFPTDTGLRYVASIQQWSGKWGTA